MTEPVELPERNWEQEAQEVIAKDHPCSYCEEAADHAHSNVQRGYRQACGGCCANHGGLTVDKHHAYDWVQSCLDRKNARIVRECAARLEAESLVAELTRQVERLEEQLQGATANEHSMVEQTAHNRGQLALVVQQKDALSVATQKLREKGQALRNLINTELNSDKAIAAADAWDRAIADTQAGKEPK